MVQKSLLGCSDGSGGGRRRDASENVEKCDDIQPVAVQCHSDSSLSRVDSKWIVEAEEKNSIERTSWPSPVSSRPSSPPLTLSPRPSLTSTVISTSVFTIVDTQTESKSGDSQRRPSILSRLKSSITTTSTYTSRRRSIQASDFRLLPEYPERRFIDSVGMVIPGVCDRKPCERSPGHFVANWRLCEPTEYTTILADHGITYTDYTRLLAALEEFVEDIPKEAGLAPKREDRCGNSRNWKRRESDRSDSDDERSEQATVKRNFAVETTEQFEKTEQLAENLNKLLSEISLFWQERGLPVMACIGSYSLFSPNRITEAHMLKLFSDYHSSILSCMMISTPMKWVQMQMRDKSQPWPLWPNAVPIRKRAMVKEHAARYGADPYFRAWMRANVNSQTRSTSYAKYMIEREDNPFINKRLEYIQSPSNKALAWALLSGGYKKWKQQYPNIKNRDNYEHNRRLESRKTIEQGSRLRIARFAFRRPIYPPHTQEMAVLGLSAEAYEEAIHEIEAIRYDSNANSGKCVPSFVPFLSRFRRRTAESAIPQILVYFKTLNAREKRIVWTIEEIPGVYDRGMGMNGKEWEISVWNGTDGLELVLQLEKWGIVEQRLTNDDDE
ncbi:hypothetical protein P154DRAFT_554931 [Amniculicola lignicola CBS 123094]|uniref:Uncharacterized protein n=1 Tax=Amniculicola lignicola CBS 123094 TaxID=1392246 RepID=A0A6A5WBS6_9PLEO|nr:hypothetical protein P154DRAFT_554931 [Amniculicola lignicola CBS 123094]